MNMNMVNYLGINNNKGLTDAKYEYKTIAYNFCDIYYKNKDANCVSVSDLFMINTLFNFLDQEFIGYTNIINKLKELGIYSFTHSNIVVNAQPISESSLLIVVCGDVYVNNLIRNKQKFNETFVLTRDNNNHFFVTNCTFRIMI